MGVVKIFRIFGYKFKEMPLEQITTEMDVQETVPKGMVRTEMGRLVKKADQEAWEKKSTMAMNKQLASRGVAKKLSAMKKPVKK